jgi:hypothetical protein
VDADQGKAEDCEQSASRVRAEWELVVTEEVEVEGKTAMDLYLTLGP